MGAAKKLLVTGGCGFIGSNFIIYMLEKYPGISITNLDLLTYAGNKDNLKGVEDDPRYLFIQGDICDRGTVKKAMEGADAVVHFAAESHVDRSIHDSSDFIRTNIFGTHILLEEAKRRGNLRIHHVSTDEVFGSLGKDGLFDEKTPYDPRSPYSASKAASDHLVRSYFHTFGLPITISNCSNNYGPFQHPEKLIPLFITNLMEGKKVPVYGKGMNIRDWLYVVDHCEAIDLIMQKGKPGETYCVGGECEKTNIQITKDILSRFGKDESSIEFVSDRKGHDLRYAIDPGKIRRELGWRPKHTFRQGMDLTVSWYKENEKWWKKLKDRKFDEFERNKTGGK